MFLGNVLWLCMKIFDISALHNCSMNSFSAELMKGLWALQISPSADPGRDICGEDQSDPMAGLSHW